MAAEAIAEVVADLVAHRARPLDDRAVYDLAASLVVDPVVVDATTIFESLLQRNDGVAIYEDHPCVAPPWDEAAICYVNTYGNVMVMHANVVPFDPDHPPWEPAEAVDWHRVRWRLDVFVWLGGRSPEAGPIPTSGPCHLWQIAIYDTGEPADIHWVQIAPEFPLDHWDISNLVLLGTLNFMACRNVDLVEPSRPRALRRRIERTGITVKTINVFPVGSSTRSPRAQGGGGVPLTPVRGHFAHYGPEYGRKLLFGKLAGKFWIAQHARGDAEVGETRSDYKLRAT